MSCSLYINKYLAISCTSGQFFNIFLVDILEWLGDLFDFKPLCSNSSYSCLVFSYFAKSQSGSIQYARMFLLYFVTIP